MHGGGAWGRGGLALLLCPEHRPDRIARGHPSCLGSILLFIHSSLPIGTFLGVLLACVCLSSGALVCWCSVVLCGACCFVCWCSCALFFDDSLMMFGDDHFLRSNIRANVGGVRNPVRGSRFGGEVVVVVVRAHQTTWLYCAQEISRLHENKKTHTHHFSPRSSIIIQNTSILRFLISLPHF